MNRILAALFVLLVLPLLAASVLLVPAGQVPDEMAHVLRADSWRRGVLIGHREDVNWNGKPVPMAGVLTDQALLRAAKAVSPDTQAQVTRENLDKARAVPWGVPSFTMVGPIAGYFPIFYTGAAVGIQAARWLGHGPLDAILFARFVNVLGFVAIGALAVLLARRGHALILAALCLPMSLNLAASISPDGLALACAALAAALLSRAADTRDSLGGTVSSNPCWLAAAVLIALVATVKPPYLPLAGALLLPLPTLGRWGAAREELLRRAGLMLLVTVLPVFWTWLTVHQASAPVMRDLYEAGPLWPGDRPAPFEATDMAAQMRVLLADPTRFVTLPLTTILGDPWIIPSMIGVLGWLNILLPHWLYRLWHVALISGAIGALWGGTAPGWRWGDLLTIAAALFACFIAIYLSQYFAWTSVGMARIDGPQGRYLLPLLPFAALGLGLGRWPADAVLPRLLTVPTLVAAAAGTVLLPWVYVSFFYVR